MEKAADRMYDIVKIAHTVQTTSKPRGQKHSCVTQHFNFSCLTFIGEESWEAPSTWRGLLGSFFNFKKQME